MAKGPTDERRAGDEGAGRTRTGSRRATRERRAKAASLRGQTYHQAAPLLAEPGVGVVNAPRLYWLGALFLAACLCAFPTDVPVAKFSRPHEVTGGHHLPSGVRKLLALSEIFGHGIGVAMAGLTVVVLDRNHRYAVIRIWACAWGSGVMVNVLKIMVGRYRPSTFHFRGGVTETFVGWFPFATSDNWRETLTNHSIQSFPSGHTATAAGLAAALAWRYPHGRWLFVFFALLGSMQRLDSGSHFLSDALAGAATAMFFSGLCLDRRVFGWLFDRLERSDKKPGRRRRKVK